MDHSPYTKPELLAIRPNEVWSWDITKIKGPFQWSYFHLYVILDIFSRYVVGWMIAARETAELAKQLIADTVEKQNIDPGTLTLHADRGTDPYTARHLYGGLLRTCRLLTPQRPDECASTHPQSRYTAPAEDTSGCALAVPWLTR